MGGPLPEKPVENRYQVLEIVNSGAMGCVYRARDLRLENTVALKKMLSSFSGDTERDYAIQRFRDEAHLLSKLHHSGLPNVIDYFTTDDPDMGETVHYLVMTFIEGKDLEALMAERHHLPLPVEDALDYFRQILEILDYLHTREPPIVYRDMKPSNIMLSGAKIYLVDFGIARIFTPQKVGTLIGTPGYAAPEQYKGFSEPRSDLYSLGVVMHYLLTGLDPQDSTKPPFTFTGLMRQNSYVPEYLDRTIESLLNFVSGKRPASAREVLTALDNRDGQHIVLSATAQRNDAELFAAVKNNDVDGVMRIICSGAPLALKDREGYTSLQRAAGEGHLGIVEVLLKMGADPNEREHNGASALTYAVLFDQKDVADLLLSHGASVRSRDGLGFTPLHVAADENLVEMAAVLLKWGARLEDRNNEGFTPLHVAADRQNNEVLDFLLLKGARVNAKSRNGLTPLHLAARRGNLEIVRLLLQKGAQIKARKSNGTTPLHYAAQNGHSEVAELLITEGSPVNVREWKYGCTPLHFSADHGHLGASELLLSKGAEIAPKDWRGRTPLHIAALEGHNDIAGLLIDRGSRVNARDLWGKTPLHLAVMGNHPGTIEVLISRGADINARTLPSIIGVTPFELANRRKNHEAADILYSHGARV